MLSLWIAVFAAILAASAPAHVLNISWKCTDGAPCLNVVLPRGATAVVGNDVDSYKLEVSVHRQETDRERILEKWSDAVDNTWSVAVDWFRLVEKGVQVPMQQCKNKLVCVVPLLDDEAMAGAVDNFYRTGLIGHHFLVKVKYEGHRAVSEQEIILERQVSGNYGKVGSASPPRVSKSPPTSVIPPQRREEGGHSPYVTRPSYRRTSSEFNYANLDEYFNKKQKEANALLVRTGQYVGAEEAEKFHPLYTIKEPTVVPPSSTNPSAQKTLPKAVVHHSKLDTVSFSNLARGRIRDFKLDSPPTVGTRYSDDNEMVRIMETSKAGNETTPWHKELKDFFTDVFVTLGPLGSILVSLFLGLSLTYLCSCSIRRLVNRCRGRRDMHEYSLLVGDKAQDSPREQADFLEESARTRKRKHKHKRFGRLRRMFRSFFKRLRGRKKGKRVTVKPSASWRESVDKKVSNKLFLESSTTPEDTEDDDESFHGQEEESSDEDSDEEDDDDLDSDDDLSDNGFRHSITRKIKETGNKVLGKIKSSESLQKLKGKVMNNAFVVGTKNAAQNIKAGKGPMGKTRVFGPKMLCSRLLEFLSIICCPCSYICSYICDCCCGWLQGNQTERMAKKANARVKEFMPSKGRLTSSSGDSESDSEDEIYVNTVEELKNASSARQCPMPSNGKNRYVPQTDIGGRFCTVQPTTLYRNSSQCDATTTEKKDVRYPISEYLDTQNNGSTSAVNEPSQDEKSLIISDVLDFGVPTANTQTSEARQHSCQLIAGDGEGTSSSACRNESLHTPRKHRCGLHCIQQKSQSKCTNFNRLPYNDTESFRRPTLPFLTPRMSRTPPRMTTPRSSSSSASIRSLRNAKSSPFSVNSMDSPASTRNSANSIFQQGNSTTSNQTALERTTNFFHQESMHMNNLMQTWEPPTQPSTSGTSTRGRSRSRAWCTQKRNRQRELCLEQEARFGRNRSLSEHMKPVEKTIVKEPALLPPALAPRFRSMDSRLPASPVRETSTREQQHLNLPVPHLISRSSSQGQPIRIEDVKTSDSKKVFPKKTSKRSHSKNEVVGRYFMGYDSSDTSSWTSASAKFFDNQNTADASSQSDMSAEFVTPRKPIVETAPSKIIKSHEAREFEMDRMQTNPDLNLPSSSAGPSNRKPGQNSGKFPTQKDATSTSNSIARQITDQTPIRPMEAVAKAQASLNFASITSDSSMGKNSTKYREEKIMPNFETFNGEVAISMPIETNRDEIESQVASSRLSSINSIDMPQQQNPTLETVLSMENGVSDVSISIEFQDDVYGSNELQKVKSPSSQQCGSGDEVATTSINQVAPISGPPFYEPVARQDTPFPVEATEPLNQLTADQITISVEKPHKKFGSRFSILNPLKKLMKLRKEDKTPKPTTVDESSLTTTASGLKTEKHQTKGLRKKFRKRKSKKKVASSSSTTSQSDNDNGRTFVGSRRIGYPQHTVMQMQTEVESEKNLSTDMSPANGIIGTSTMEVENEYSGSSKISGKFSLRSNRPYGVTMPNSYYVTSSQSTTPRAMRYSAEYTEKRGGTFGSQDGTSSYSVVNESINMNRYYASPRRSRTPSVGPHSPSSMIQPSCFYYSGCSNGDNRLVSISNSHNVLLYETDSFQSKTDDLNDRQNGAPIGEYPRFFSSSEQNVTDEQYNRSCHEFYSPVTTLNSAALDFSREEECNRHSLTDESERFWGLTYER